MATVRVVPHFDPLEDRHASVGLTSKSPTVKHLRRPPYLSIGRVLFIPRLLVFCGGAPSGYTPLQEAAKYTEVR